MRASDLLSSTVVDASGATLGRVLDVRLVQDSPAVGDRPVLRLDGLVLGRHALASRLGYRHGDVTGPWLLAVLCRRLLHGQRYLPWDQVDHVRDGVVRARPGYRP